MKFNELPLHQNLLKGIEHASFVECMTVQENVLPVSLTGKDVMVQSKTGSGKTAVFLITILQKLAQQNAERQSSEEAPADTFALIIAPTRELAVQIEGDARLLSHGMKGTRIGCFYGGVGYQEQDRMLKDGVDIVIGTPGRILDYQKMGKLDFRKVNAFVIDEADRLFDMGFYPDIQRMFSLMSPKEKRQTMLFSATLSNRVRNLAWKYMNEPQEFEVQMEELTVTNITQELYHVSSDEKFSIMLRLLEKEQPENCLIFTNTKARAVEVTKRLQLNNYKAQYLMGDLPQNKRLQVINRMKSGELKFLVATDVAARGLQIDDLELVVNYDIPEDFENYVHRIGRTARAGKSGKSITLGCEEFVYSLESIESYIQMKIPVLWVDEETIPLVKDASAGMSFRDLVPRKEFGAKSDGRGRRESSRSPRGGRKPQGARTAKPKTHTPVHHADASVKKHPAQSSAVKKPHPPQKYRTGRPGKSYQEIQKMDLNQRMDYYKNMYMADGATSEPERETVDSGKSSPPKTKGKNRSPRGQKAAGSASPSPEKKQTEGSRKKADTRAKSSPAAAEESRTAGKAPAGDRRRRNPAAGKGRVESSGVKKGQPAAPEKRPEEQKTQERPKKKGLIARLFGR